MEKQTHVIISNSELFSLGLVETLKTEKHEAFSFKSMDECRLQLKDLRPHYVLVDIDTVELSFEDTEALKWFTCIAIAEDPQDTNLSLFKGEMGKPIKIKHLHYQITKSLYNARK